VGNNINAGAGNSLVVGMDLMVDITSTGVEIFGKGTSVVGPQSNVLAVGAGSIESDEAMRSTSVQGSFMIAPLTNCLMNGILTAKEDQVDLAVY
jgi:hypothetical protein